MKRSCSIFILLLFTFLPFAEAQTNTTIVWYHAYVTGSVSYANNISINAGIVRVLSSTTNDTTDCAISDGRYSCILSGIPNTVFSFYIVIDGIVYAASSSYTLIQDNVNLNLNLIAPINAPTTASNNFPDTDRDGVPDDRDYCPSSDLCPAGFSNCEGDPLVAAIDKYGCNCIQKTANQCNGIFCCPSGYGCQISEDRTPECMSIKPVGCEPPGQCIPNQPSRYCNENSTIVIDSNKCGCPDTFTAQPETGKCVKTVKMKGLKCKKTPYRIAFAPFRKPNHFCRHQFGPEWVSEDSLERMFEVPQIRNLRNILHFVMPLEWSLLASIPFFITICTKTDDQGCVPEEVVCEGEAGAKRSIEDIESEIKRRFKIHVSLDELNFKVGEPYYCPDAQLTSDLLCKKMIDNGDSNNKIDILFVGDQFVDDSVFDEAVVKLVDYNGNNGFLGLFSEEPFKSNKDKFNIWAVNAKDMLRHGYYYGRERSGGTVPHTGDVALVAKSCPVQADQIVVLSVNGYRSFGFFDLDMALCSVGSYINQEDGRLVLHEFGHSFGKLADEYYEYVEDIDSESKLASYAHVGALNCQKTQTDAELVWGYMVGRGTGAGQIGYFQSCGNICGEGCASFIRPTSNSIMRDLRQGGFFNFNKKLIEERIKNAVGSVVSTLD